MGNIIIFSGMQGQAVNLKTYLYWNTLIRMFENKSYYLSSSKFVTSSIGQMWRN